MSGRGKHVEIDVFGDEKVPSRPGKLWPEEEDYRGKLGRAKHDAHGLIRFAERSAKARANAVKRNGMTTRRSPSPAASGPANPSPLNGHSEPWMLPATHPAAGMTYGLGRVRRVTVKARYRLNGSRGDGPTRGQPLHKHLVYLARPEAQEPSETEVESSTSEAPAAIFFDQDRDSFDASDRPHAWRSDRHHWRLIVSPENAGDLNLKDFGRTYMRRIERVLGRRLEWFGVVHVNTEHPHLHLLIRGKRDDGKDLTMTPATVSHALRELAEEELGKRLGVHDEKTADLSLTAMTRLAKPTPLDDLLDRIAGATDGSGSGKQSFRLPRYWVPEACGLHHLQQRLETLQRLGLATREERDTSTWSVVTWWSLKPAWRETLAYIASIRKADLPSPPREQVAERGPCGPSRKLTRPASKSAQSNSGAEL